MDEEDRRCARCGKIDPDVRTLWMACMYQMNEMRGVPFEQCAIHGVYQAKVGEEKTMFGAFPTYSAAEGAKPHTFPFYTLTVCKTCRAEWMAAIGVWFVDRSEEDDEDEAEDEVERCVPMRVLGTTVMMTPAEAQAYRSRMWE